MSRPSRALLTALALSSFVAPAAHAQPIFRTVEGGPRLTVEARVATGVQPKSVTVSPHGLRVVVCNFGRPDVDNVSVYDAYTLELVGTVSFEGNAVESTFSADGRTLYVSNFREDRVEVIEFGTLRHLYSIPVGSHPKTLSLSADEHTLYVANYFGRSVSVVDLETRREVRQLPTGERPRGMGLLGDGTLLAAAFNDDVVHAFEPGASAERERWRVCRYPRDVLPAPGGEVFYMTCSLGNIGFYRGDGGGRPFGMAATGRNPRSIGLSRDGRWLGVANFTSSDVTLIDTVARTHRRARVPGASRIVGLAMHPYAGIRLYATSWDTGELIVLTAPTPAPPEPTHEAD